VVLLGQPAYRLVAEPGDVAPPFTGGRAEPRSGLLSDPVAPADRVIDGLFQDVHGEDATRPCVIGGGPVRAQGDGIRRHAPEDTADYVG
jgi:hypothetical protein